MAKVAVSLMWAQRKDRVFVTFLTPDTVSPSVEFTANELKFKSKFANGNEGERVIELFKEIDSDNCQLQINSREIFVSLPKKDEDAEFWPRLTSQKLRDQTIKTDFDKWRDEDDEDYEEDGGFNFDSDMGDMMGGMGGMGGMPGMGGMGGMDGFDGMDSDDDEDADDMPDLEDAEDKEAPKAAADDPPVNGDAPAAAGDA